jgi:hypothetical protein
MSHAIVRFSDVNIANVRRQAGETASV